ncbi:MAG: 8-amino-7-oxononanoate synthase [Bryobacteraceae bacterium]
MTLEHRVRAHLAEIDRTGLRRTMRPPSGVDLSSNDYLCLSTHPLITERMAKAVQELGAGSTGSRLLRGDREAFESIEQKFATFKGTERALYFSTGYLANLAVLTTFPQEGDVVFSDSLNHASLIDGVRLSRAKREIYPHNTVPAARGHFLVTESLFSMDGDFAPLPELSTIEANLIVDEAHSVGLYGNNGSGLIEDNEVFLSINPCGKALGVSGAFVCGPAWAIEYMVQTARPFIFSTAAPPSIAAALDASLDIIAAEPERRARVRSLSRFLRAKLAMPDSDSPILPIMIGDNTRAVALAEALQRDGFDIRAIRPPTVPAGTARLRLSLNCNLTEAILDRFVASLEHSQCAASS